MAPYKLLRSFERERSKLKTVADVTHGAVAFSEPNGARHAFESFYGTLLGASASLEQVSLDVPGQ